MHEIRVIRVYDDLTEWTGIRILVDRLWPRGRKKEDLALDHWAKEAAPSTHLRKKFHQDGKKFHQDGKKFHQDGKHFHLDEDTFPAFREEYRLELDAAAETEELQAFLARVRQDLEQAPVAFLYGARSREFNHAIVLKEWVEKKLEEIP